MRRSFAALVLALTSLAFAAPAQAIDLVEMPPPENGEYVLSSPVGRPGQGRHWGRPEMVRHLILVAKEWRKRHPDLPRLRIGDIAKFGGGPFPPHKTHQDGLSVDIFTAPQNICHINYKDQSLTQELAELFVQLGARQILYNHPRVIAAVPVVRKYPKHDNHFHVVIDPGRVPQDGEALVIPASGAEPGALIGLGRVDEEGRGLDLSWRVIGGQHRAREARVEVDDRIDENGILYDSGVIKARRARHEVGLALLDGGRYRWRVHLDFGKGGSRSSAWANFDVDITPPRVIAIEPVEDARIPGEPRFEWRTEEEGLKYRVEVSTSSRGRRAKVIGSGSGGAFTASTRLFKRRKIYYWRVVVIDGAGNEGASPWRSFRTIKGEDESKDTDKGTKAPTGEVTAKALNVREGPGTSHGKVGLLKQGDAVKVLGEESGWLKIEFAEKGGRRKGYVARRFIKISGEG